MTFTFESMRSAPAALDMPSSPAVWGTQKRMRSEVHHDHEDAHRAACWCCLRSDTCRGCQQRAGPTWHPRRLIRGPPSDGSRGIMLDPAATARLHARRPPRSTPSTTSRPASASTATTRTGSVGAPGPASSTGSTAKTTTSTTCTSSPASRGPSPTSLAPGRAADRPGHPLRQVLTRHPSAAQQNEPRPFDRGFAGTWCVI